MLKKKQARGESREGRALNESKKESAKEGQNTLKRVKKNYENEEERAGEADTPVQGVTA